MQIYKLTKVFHSICVVFSFFIFGLSTGLILGTFRESLTLSNCIQILGLITGLFSLFFLVLSSPTMRKNIATTMVISLIYIMILSSLYASWKLVTYQTPPQSEFNCIVYHPFSLNTNEKDYLNQIRYLSNDIELNSIIFNTITLFPEKIPQNLIYENIVGNQDIFSKLNRISPPPSFKEDHDLLKTIVSFHIWHLQAYLRKDYQNSINRNKQLSNIYYSKIEYYKYYLKNKINEI